MSVVPSEFIASASLLADLGNDFAAWDRATQYLDDLASENEKYNLTAVPREQSAQRHFLDSILITGMVPEGGSVLDIGTGAGFPAWPLALVRPDLHVVALDSTAKRLRFIDRHPLPNLKTWLRRAEDEPLVEEFDFVTGRALAPLAAHLELSAAWAKVGGLVVPFRSESDLEEIERLDVFELGLVLESLERTEIEGAVRMFPLYRKVVATDPKYPRTWAEIKNRPIN